MIEQLFGPERCNSLCRRDRGHVRGPAGRWVTERTRVERLEMIRQMLKKQEYRVLAANTPGEAMRMANAHPGGINLLITDVVMPGMNGRDLAERLQALYPNLKVLFMSGYTVDAIVHHGVLERGVHFVQKPFNLKDPAHKVRQAIGKQEERRNREISNHKM
jgi:DNA-binding NtrC family response regulator